jgi:hypothetical protein
VSSEKECSPAPTVEKFNCSVEMLWQSLSCLAIIYVKCCVSFAPAQAHGSRSSSAALSVSTSREVAASTTQGSEEFQQFAAFLLEVQTAICNEAQAADASGAEFCVDK